MAYKTPGVYIEEISKFPPSVAEVETTVPAFIGYTEKAERKGEDLTLVPIKIRSLLEYNQYFGFEPRTDKIEIKVDQDKNYAVTEIEISKHKFMYEALRTFFDNGGGKCYIISVGKHTEDVSFGDDTSGLKGGLKALEKYDEPTMILFPDATLLHRESEFYSLQQAALAQCAKLQDRVGVFDLFEKRKDAREGWRRPWKRSATTSASTTSNTAPPTRRGCAPRTRARSNSRCSRTTLRTRITRTCGWRHLPPTPISIPWCWQPSRRWPTSRPWTTVMAG